jgi:hypothetical protein
MTYYKASRCGQEEVSYRLIKDGRCIVLFDDKYIHPQTSTKRTTVVDVAAKFLVSALTGKVKHTSALT